MSLFSKWLAPFTEAEDGDIDSLIRWHLHKTIGGEEPPPDVWWKLRARLSARPAARPERPRQRFWRAFLQRTQPLVATALLVMVVGAALARGQVGLLYGAGPTRIKPTVGPSAQAAVEAREVSPHYTVLKRGELLPDGGVAHTDHPEKETRPAMPEILTLGKPREVRPS